jgi:hypothetical protein
MRVYLVHTVFAVILLGTLLANDRAADMAIESDDIEPAAIRLARSHGLVLRGDAPATDANFRVLTFDAQSCAAPILVVLLSVTFEQEALVRSLLAKQHDVLRYVYLDRSWDMPDRFAVFVEWKKHRILSALGLTPYVATKNMLLLASPPNCHAADTIDWKVVWDRNYLAAARADYD